MAGATHQIQIRHILLDKKEVADLLKETIESLPNATARVQIQHLYLIQARWRKPGLVGGRLE